MIERDGVITKCVPLSRVAFHAGKSVGPQGLDVNRYSIGISFANYESKGEAITAAQVEACKELCVEIAKAPGVKWLTTHYWISPGRKSDPSRLRFQDLMGIEKAANLIIWRPK